jgi:predicted ribosomally synthesized peptide with nif11-like leader
MSMESVYKFLTLVNEDAGIQTRILQLTNGGIHDLIALARAEGCEFNKDEFHAVATKTYQQSQNELSEDELEMVSGGVMSNNYSNYFMPTQTPPSIIAVLIGL